MDRRKILFVHNLLLSQVAGTTVLLDELLRLIPSIAPDVRVGYESPRLGEAPDEAVRRLSEVHGEVDSVVAVNMHAERGWDYALLVFEWCQRSGITLYLYVHDYWPHHRQRLHWLSDEYGARMLASSEYIHRLMADDGIETTLLQVGVSLSHLDLAPQSAGNNTGKVVASTGRLVPRKRFADVVRAFAAADVSHLSTLRLRLLPSVVFPPKEDARRLRELELLAQASGVPPESVRLLENGTSHHSYRGYAVCITASNYEGFSMPPIEAAYSGCPPLMSDIPAHRRIATHLFRDGSDRFLYPVGDHQALASLLRDEIRTGDRLAYVTEHLQQIRADIDTDLSLRATAEALVRVTEPRIPAGS